MITKFKKKKIKKTMDGKWHKNGGKMARKFKKKKQKFNRKMLKKTAKIA